MVGPHGPVARHVVTQGGTPRWVKGYYGHMYRVNAERVPDDWEPELLDPKSLLKAAYAYDEEYYHGGRFATAVVCRVVSELSTAGWRE